MKEQMTQREWDRVVGWGSPPVSTDRVTIGQWKRGELNVLMASSKTGKSKWPTDKAK